MKIAQSSLYELIKKDLKKINGIMIFDKGSPVYKFEGEVENLRDNPYPVGSLTLVYNIAISSKNIEWLEDEKLFKDSFEKLKEVKELLSQNKEVGLANGHGIINILPYIGYQRGLIGGEFDIDTDRDRIEGNLLGFYNSQEKKFLEEVILSTGKLLI